MSQRPLLFWILSASVALVAGCASSASVGVSDRTYVDKSSATVCSSHCETIGMTLSSVVIMANNVGCVCEAPPAPGSPGSTRDPAAGDPTSVDRPAGEPQGVARRSSAAGGMAAIMIAEEAARASSRKSHHNNTSR